MDKETILNYFYKFILGIILLIKKVWHKLEALSFFQKFILFIIIIAIFDSFREWLLMLIIKIALLLFG